VEKKVENGYSAPFCPLFTKKDGGFSAFYYTKMEGKEVGEEYIFCRFRDKSIRARVKRDRLTAYVNCRAPGKPECNEGLVRGHSVGGCLNCTYGTIERG